MAMGPGYGMPPGGPGMGGYPAPGGPGMGGYAPPAGAGGYEFTQIENSVIEKTGSRARMFGVIQGIVGVLSVLIGIAMIVAGPPIIKGAGGGVLASALVAAFSAKFYLEAGKALGSVVTTQGNDIPLMIEALSKLRNAVRLEAIVSIAGFVLGLVLGIALAASA